MVKPAIMIVDNYPQVLNELESDLEKKYSERFRLVKSESGQQALKRLKHMKLHNEPVALIVGGANSAGQGAVYFAKYARHVTMLVRADLLEKSMSKYLIDQIEDTENIEVKTCTRVVGVQGKRHLQSITICNDNTHEEGTRPATSLFIFIGAKPHTNWLKGVVKRDNKGFILTGPDLMHEGQPPKGWPLQRDPFFLETNVPGIFTAGDVRHDSVKRVASSVGEGAMAIQFVHHYLSEV